jgi:DivIVA domain-containing protein
MSFPFPNAKTNKLGYRPADVDEFITQARAVFNSNQIEEIPNIREKEFTLEKGGYSVSAVDAALDRLEDTFAARRLQRFIDAGQLDDLLDRLNELKVLLVGRVERPARKRFSTTGYVYRGYSRKEVDRFVGLINAHLNGGEKMSVDAVRKVLFTPKRGGYVESQVDLFIDKVVELIQIEKVL